MRETKVRPPSKERRLRRRTHGCQHNTRSGKRDSIAWIHCWKVLKMIDPKVDLEIVRFVAASRAKLWRAWSDPDIVRQWWCPKPWVTEVRAFDFRNGGAFHTIMSGPDGGKSDNPGLFLEIVRNTKTWASSMAGEP
jgi:hypothetical protein